MTPDIVEKVGLTDRERRTMSDPQRLLWADDVVGICQSASGCFEYSATVRCGPCAIKQATAHGVESNMSLPNLPEVSRLRRELAIARKIEGGLGNGARPLEHQSQKETGNA